jgi:hypothetical protein
MAGIEKGESRNSRRAPSLFIASAKSATAPTRTSTALLASNLLVTAITLWNTRYLHRAIAALRETEAVPDHLLAHLSPLGWAHINLTGDYVWSAVGEMTANRDGFRPLRPTPPDPALIAA